MQDGLPVAMIERPLPNEPVYKVLVEGDEVFVER
jgi:hypothetical protein